MCCWNTAFSFVITVSMLDLVVKASVNLQVISQSIFGSWLPEDWCGRCLRWGHWLNRPTRKVFNYVTYLIYLSISVHHRIISACKSKQPAWKVLNYGRICYKQYIAKNREIQHIYIRQNPNSTFIAGSPQYWMTGSKKIWQCLCLCCWTSTLLDNMMQVSSWLLGKMM